MGQNRKIYEKFKNRFFENVQDFIFGIYSVILCMGLGLSRVIKRSICLHTGDFGTFSYFWLLGRNYLIYLVNLYRKPLKTTSEKQNTEFFKCDLF
jgi:hypothetical protein